MNFKKLNTNAAHSFAAIEANSGMTREEMSDVKGGAANFCETIFIDSQTGSVIGSIPTWCDYPDTEIIYV